MKGRWGSAEEATLVWEKKLEIRDVGEGRKMRAGLLLSRL
jgi:hypothetical protein